ncbi:MAG: MASE2 domain-containing protein [Pseudomonas sp.]
MAIDRSRAAGLSFAKRVYVSRIVGCALCLFFVATTLYPGSQLQWVLMLLNSLVWPHIAFQLVVRARDPYKAELRNLQLDCLYGGGWLVAMHFSLLPTVLMLSTMAMNSVTTKGLRFMLRGLVANAVGVLAAGLVMGFEVNLDTPPQVIWACLPMLVLYPFTVGYSSYDLAVQLLRQRRALAIVTGFDERLFTPLEQWMFRLGQALLRCRCGSSHATVVVIRIDEFRALSDQHGLLLMEALSARLGQLIKGEVRNTDLLCTPRAGEFYVLLQHAGEAGARSLAERVEGFFAEPMGSNEGLPEARIRVGIVEFSYGFISENEWLEEAKKRASQTAPARGALAMQSA